MAADKPAGETPAPATQGLTHCARGRQGPRGGPEGHLTSLVCFCPSLCSAVSPVSPVGFLL